MSDRNALIVTIMVLVLALIMFAITRNMWGELRILNDRVETANMNGHLTANPVPVAGDDTP